jgi:type IV pilus assembly protein PilN
MIRINLLPVRAKQKRNTNIWQLAAIGAVAVFTVGVALASHFAYANKVSDLEARVAANKESIAELQKIIGEVNELDKQRERLKKQLGVIETLERSKKGPVRVLDELVNAIPKKVWLSSFDEKGGTLTLKGTAMDNADISEFVRTLGKTPYFKDIQIKFSQVDSKGSLPVYNFEIGCKVDYAA